MESLDQILEEFNVPEVVDKTSGFFKIADGEVKKVRLLSSGPLGYEIRVDKKPLRSANINELPEKDENGNGPREFWAMGIYNLTEKKLQIWNCNLISIRKQIKDHSLNPDWGNPKGYDLTIKRVKHGIKTDYSATPAPLAKLSDEEVAMIDGYWFDWSELSKDGFKVITEKESKF